MKSPHFRLIPVAWVVLSLTVYAASPAIAGVGRLIKQRSLQVAPGVQYTEYHSKGRRSVTVHAVVYDLTATGKAIRLVKAGKSTTGRQSLVEMANSYQEESKNTVLALINANFWSAVRSTPIGPCVVDGEVVEMLPYKHWSSAFIGLDNKVVIDSFVIKASLECDGKSYAIQSANRRTSDSAVVLYNSYAGTSVPFVSPALLEHLYAQMLRDSVFLIGDSTEQLPDTAAMRKEIERVRKESDVEHGLMKIQLRYVGQPAVNTPTPCIVLASGTGEVAMPENGCVISIPKNVSMLLPSVGDTVSLLFQTNVHSNTKFMNAVCGTPRLVRNGRARHEAKQEGVTGRRFIGQRLARTCLGTNKSGSQLILASIEPTYRAQRQLGTTLTETAQVMKMLGAYQAMNLDGGGSAGMVVMGRHVFFDNETIQTRPVSVGLAIVELASVLRQYPK